MTREELNKQIKDLEASLWEALRKHAAHLNMPDSMVSEFAVYAITGTRPTWET